jgi:hypothetical protein
VALTATEATDRIHKVLAAEISAIQLSNLLFTPEGLFHWLGASAEDRKQVVISPLFQQAQRRLRELQHREMAALRESQRTARSA